MTDVVWNDRSKSWAVFLVVLANLLQSISVGINAVIFTTALSDYGYGTGIIGLVMAIEYLSIFGIGIYLPKIMSRMGMMTGLEIATLFRLPALLLLGYVVSAGSWAFWVFIHGIGNFLFGVLLQTWINAIPFQRRRGFSMGLFGTSISLGLALGPVLLSMVDSLQPVLKPILLFTDQVIQQWTGWTVPEQVSDTTRIGLILSALLSTIAVLPVMLGRFVVPKLRVEDRENPFRMVVRAPAIMFAVLLCGFSILGLQSLITVYGLKNGMSFRDASFLLTAFMLGSITLEMPLAALSDWFDRRYVMIALVLLSLVMATYLPMAIYWNWTAWGLLFIWGGMIGALFSICLALIAERFEGRDLVAANAAFTLMDNIGGMVGVLAIGLGMQVFGVDGLPYAIMMAAVLYFTFALTRFQVR